VTTRTETRVENFTIGLGGALLVFDGARKLFQRGTSTALAVTRLVVGASLGLMAASDSGLLDEIRSQIATAREREGRDVGNGQSPEAGTAN